MNTNRDFLDWPDDEHQVVHRTVKQYKKKPDKVTEWTVADLVRGRSDLVRGGLMTVSEWRELAKEGTERMDEARKAAEQCR